VHVDARGAVTYTGKVEIGQNIRTSLSQVVADELRVPLSAITFIMADTDLTVRSGHVRIEHDADDGAAIAAAAATAREC
jgi:isoquinoline 1-oxidoreductase